MLRETARRHFVIRAFAVGLAGVATGCGDGGSPVHPSAPPTRSVAPATETSPAPPTAAVPLSAAAALTPANLTERGWTCFQPPVQPVRTICSHPNQGLPVVGNPPPADRPATYNLWRFDENGQFVGPVFLIRTDLYNGQVCESSGESYVYVPIIGYYECVHPVSR
jgi:hypothetical protein